MASSAFQFAGHGKVELVDRFHEGKLKKSEADSTHGNNVSQTLKKLGDDIKNKTS
jgi:hypothetical protein